MLLAGCGDGLDVVDAFFVLLVVRFDKPRRKGWSRDAGSIRGQSCGGRQAGVQIVFSYREVKEICPAGFDGKKVEGRQDQGPDAVHVRGAGTPFDIDVAIGARNDSSVVVNSWNEAGICSCCSLLRKADH